MTLVDKKGLIKGYSFVNVKEYSMVSYGETLKEAYANYVKLLNENGKNSLKNSSDLLEVKGVINRIGVSTSQGIYNIMLDNDKRIFKVSDTFDEVTLSKVGESVTIKYIENSNIINAKDFDNTTIQNNN